MAIVILTNIEGSIRLLTYKNMLFMYLFLYCNCFTRLIRAYFIFIVTHLHEVQYLLLMYAVVMVFVELIREL